MRLAGPVLTVKGTPTVIDKLEYLQLAMQAYSFVEPGTVVIFDTGSDPSTAHWGEMLSTTTQAKGCGGAVLDGGVRDVDAIKRLGFPVLPDTVHQPISVVAGAMWKSMKIFA